MARNTFFNISNFSHFLPPVGKSFYHRNMLKRLIKAKVNDTFLTPRALEDSPGFERSTNFLIHGEMFLADKGLKEPG